MALKPAFTATLRTHLSDPTFEQPKWDPLSVQATLNNACTPSSSPSTATQPPKSDLIRDLLKTVIRPAFSSPKTITAQGRKAMPSWQPATPYDSEAAEASKPWRSAESWVVDAFEWCLDALDAGSVEEHWPMMVPPVLAHIDDDAAGSKVRGVGMLRRLLEITPSALLARTGLADVFEEALLPHLAHIPPAYEEAEALELLGVVYPTFLKLIQVRYPGRAKLDDGKHRSLDRVLRKGVFMGLGQLRDEVNVSKLLLVELGRYLDELGILCVKHLKVMLPLVSDRLTSPFANAAPHLMLEAAKALAVIMQNARPRVPHWRLEILEALAIAWIRIQNDQSVQETCGGLVSLLGSNVDLLGKILAEQDEEDGIASVKRVLESDKRLAALLEILNKSRAEPSS